MSYEGTLPPKVRNVEETIQNIIEENKPIQGMNEDSEIISTHYKVSKSNILIDSIYSLSSIEQKVLLIVISLIHPKDEDLKTYRVSISSIREIMGIEDKGFYTKMKQLTYNILTKPFWYKDNETGRELQGSWFSTCEYKKGEGIVEFEFSPKVKELLIKLKHNFTSYMLGYVVKLKSKYSIRMYEILKKHQYMKSVIFDVDELKKLLGIDINKQYKSYGHFNTRVLKSSITEINEHTDITIRVSEITTGRKVVRLKFNITENKKNRTNKKEQIDLFEMNEIGYSLYNHIKDESKVVKLIKEYDSDYIEDKISQFEYEVEYNYSKVERYGKEKYLILSIKNNWKEPLYEEYKKEQSLLKIKREKIKEKKRIEDLRNEYNVYCDSLTMSYSELKRRDKKKIDKLTDKRMSVFITNTKLTKETIEQIRNDTINEVIREEMNKDVLSFEEWVRDR